MRRRSFLCLAMVVFFVGSHAAGDEPERAPLTLNTGPHLFIDDHLIAEQSFLQRTVNNPTRLPEPVIPGGDPYRICQPYVSVVRDAKTGTFRMWYEVPAPDPPPPYTLISSDFR